MSEYKQCPNGHYYQGDHCPYCKNGKSVASSADPKETEVFRNPASNQQPTETFSSGSSGGTNTTMVEGLGVLGASGMRPNGGISPSQVSNRTVFTDEYDHMSDAPMDGGEKGPNTYRDARKMVGWLVSYTIDPMGVDFKLYEGRNIIGRNMDCNITVNDNMVSSRHAVLLFRAGKYSISDSQSSHGTFVNDVDIELEPYYLQDGDVIKIGKTVFKFRTSF